MSSSSTIGALIPKISERKEPQDIDIDLYLKFYFTTLQDKYLELDDNCDHKVSEGLIFRNIIGDGHEFLDVEDKITYTIFIDCSDCTVNEELNIIEAEGAIIKIIHAVECLNEIAKKYLYTTRRGKIHVAIFGINLVEDIAQSFAYIVDDESGLPIHNEKLCSYVLKLDKVFDEIKNRNWFLYTDYLTILDYYVLVEPRKGQSSVYELEIEKTHLKTEEYDEISETYQSDTLLLKGGITYEHVLSPIEKDCLNDFQEILDWVSMLPGGEVVSLINGFIYLGKEIKACNDWDIDKIEYNKLKAIESFVGAIPGASIVKAAIKIKKASKAYKQIEKSNRILENIAKKERKSTQAINRMRKKKISSKRKSTIKKRHVLNNNITKKAKINIEEIQKIHSKRIEDSGLTIENLTNEGKDFWAKSKTNYKNYRTVLDKTMKNNLPQSDVDKKIDNIDRLWDAIQKSSEDARYREPEAAVL